MKKVFLGIVLGTFLASSLFGLAACGGKQHWGQDLNPEKKWWKKEGHSWDRKHKIFMAIGYSNPEWEDQNAKRKSADLAASGEASKFMQQLVKTYIREANYDNYKVNEDVVESSSHETLIGSVIVSRKYIKKNKEYRSLLQVDLSYFFDHLNKRLLANEKERMQKKTDQLSPEEADEKIMAHLGEIETKLENIETKTLDKTFPE